MKHAIMHQREEISLFGLPTETLIAVTMVPGIITLVLLGWALRWS
ncbi:hypothetical protein [Methanothrix sp.]|nr:hypothetical protein [Methanothrix sp.]